MTTFRQAADAGYLELVKLWQGGKAFEPIDRAGGGCFWMAWNTLQVAIDYLVQTGQNDKDNFMIDALDFFDRKVKDENPKNWKNDKIWMDDYGWWGVILAKAYQYSKELGYDNNQPVKQKIARYAKNCWIGMHEAWDTSEMPNTDPNVKITGGIANIIDANTPKMSGRNCVTNELYWLLSLLLVEVMKDKSFLDPLTDEEKWFESAIRQCVLANANNLVLERFKGVPNHTNPNVDGLYWIGDQGLFMGCCEANARYGTGELGMLAAYNIAAAVKQNMTLKGLVLHEDLFQLTEFQLDYAGGKGVFIRNLQVLNARSHGEQGDNYDPLIKANAAAVWNHRLADDKFRYFWNAEAKEPADWGYNKSVSDAVVHASGLSAMTAALPWFANQEIAPAQL
jgi:hypothetical protein